MTIAVAIKVSDGIVLAADSATTIPLSETSRQIYNNGNKIVNLHKDLPIGVMTWRAGNIGAASMSSIFKDFRDTWTGQGVTPMLEWTVESIATDLAEYMYDSRATSEGVAHGGTAVAGWSREANSSCLYVLDNESETVSCVIPESEPAQVMSWGQPDTISRLLNGFSLGMADLMVNRFGVPEDELQQALSILASELSNNKEHGSVCLVPR